MKKNVLGASIVPLNKNYFIFPDNYELKYFYESSPSATYEEPQDWLDYVPRYTINSDSLNERFEYTTDGAKPNTYRIITMGDSFTFGHYVNTENNWPEQLEIILNKQPLCPQYSTYEVINFGQPGYDVQYDVERYKKRGPKYKPDLVIWFLHGERWNELMRKETDACEAALPDNSFDYAKCWDSALQKIYQDYTARELFELQRKLFNDFSNVFHNKLLFITQQHTAYDYKIRLKHFVSERPETYYFEGLPDLGSINGILKDGHPSASGHEAIAVTLAHSPIIQQLICEK